MGRLPIAIPERPSRASSWGVQRFLLVVGFGPRQHSFEAPACQDYNDLARSRRESIFALSAPSNGRTYKILISRTYRAVHSKNGPRTEPGIPVSGARPLLPASEAIFRLVPTEQHSYLLVRRGVAETHVSIGRRIRVPSGRQL